MLPPSIPADRVVEDFPRKCRRSNQCHTNFESIKESLGILKINADLPCKSYQVMHAESVSFWHVGKPITKMEEVSKSGTYGHTICIDM